ncbi:hypothetical protein CCYA_CCYA13G3504 [Cyanidiococcus yangmingshanensis]|nr:hypothetical protein CCYA_CCYA13G3504 [Cyanidiococcus yangmingshanensis]
MSGEEVDCVHQARFRLLESVDGTATSSRGGDDELNWTGEGGGAAASATLRASPQPSSSSSNATRLEFADEYELLAPLGEGSYGTVWGAVAKRSGETVAIKRLYRQPFSASHELERWRRWAAPSPQSGPPDCAERERQLVLSIPPHPNLVRCDACLPWVFSDGSEVPSPQEILAPDLALIMERGYSLSSLFCFNGRFIPERLWLRLIQVVGKALFEALAHLHAHGVVHRDVRLDHVLVRCPPDTLWTALEAGSVPGPEHFFLCDFSLTRRCCANAAGDGAESPTLPYAPIRPPEVFFGDTRRLPSGDIWSAGCVLLELLLRQAGEPVFDCGCGAAMSELRSLSAIFELVGSPDDSWLTSTDSSSIYAWIQPPRGRQSLLSKRITQCWDVDQVQGTLDDAIDLIQRLLEFRAERRPTAVEALHHPFLHDSGK